MPLIAAVVKGISAGVGAAGEKYHDRKERKAALAAQEASSSMRSGSEAPNSLVNTAEPGAETADDERIWILDEATGPPPSYDSQNFDQRPVLERTISELTSNILALTYQPDTPETAAPSRLPYPIIIPQRRPGTKARGFARAYPPDLEAFGIDQDAFLQIFQNFDEASQASPWLKTLYLSAGIIGLVPSTIAMAVSITLQAVSGVAMDLQTRYKANAFLDQINKELFMPLGLYCMVMACKDGPGAPQNSEFSLESVNLDTAKHISEWGLPKPDPTAENSDHNSQAAISKSKQLFRPIRTSSGKTNVSDMPLEIAPLIYPALDAMLDGPQVTPDESLKARMLRHKDFYADYFDRRARADYAGNNPDSTLTKASSGTSEFRTRFADPNHPVNNGHLISLITGGNVVAQPRGRRRNLREVGPDGKLKPKEKESERRVAGPVGLVSKGVKKVLKPNILYFTIVNMPSRDELAEARAALGI
ncbi:hypothetical protein DM02DRAFT_612426 [Periconia macrospinosa]|uniref:Uncharacterized protein n=1 Tax=Periconia macrospinosa TaxID=97972 RepID=A0A2V1DYC6_9PLEO|nr:hypothetical protein DM02DRAFT_612426 [Periconia macrospinosa]